MLIYIYIYIYIYILYRPNDGEKSIVALVETVNAIRTNDTVPDNCPVEEHYNNGAVERCHRIVTQHFRTIRDHVEAKIGAKVEHRNPLLQWLVLGAVNLKTRYGVGECGKSPYERIKGSRSLKALTATGELIHFLPERQKRR